MKYLLILLMLLCSSCYRNTAPVGLAVAGSGLLILSAPMYVDLNNDETGSMSETQTAIAVTTTSLGLSCWVIALILIAAED